MFQPLFLALSNLDLFEHMGNTGSQPVLDVRNRLGGFITVPKSQPGAVLFLEKVAEYAFVTGHLS